MKKLVFVVQRYGVEVNGGAEQHCRMLAERLVDFFDVTVLTTCALEYDTWENFYNEGEEIINGVKVRRFKVDFRRDNYEFDILSSKVFADPKNLNLGLNWIEKQGPYSTGLFEELKVLDGEVDCFIFFTYLYAPSFFGTDCISKSKKFLVPLAHDEKPLYLRIYDDFFNKFDGLIFNTDAEKRLLERRCGSLVDNIVVGVSVDFPGEIGFKNRRAKEKFSLENYCLYAGRLDEAKGVSEMIGNFQKFKEVYKNDLKLVLIGRGNVDIPKTDDIIYLGFVDEMDKWDLIFDSKVFLIPSYFESLSLVLLESFYCGKPVLVNGACEVLKDHCLNSNAGLYYDNVYEFIESMNYLNNLSYLEMENFSNNAKKYVKENYDWEVIFDKIYKFIKKEY